MAKKQSKQKKSTKKRQKKKKSPFWRVLGLFILLVCIGVGSWGFYRYLHPLELKGESYDTELKEPFDAYGNIQSILFHPIESVTFVGNVKTEEVASFDVSYTFEGESYPFTVNVVDTKGPILEVQDLTVDINTPVTAEDFITKIGDASNYSFRMDGQTDPGQTGTFTVTLTARDTYNNLTTKTAKLTRKADKTAPTLEGFDERVVLLQGDMYAPRTYTIVDDLDNDPKVYIDSSQLNIKTPGTYTVQYTTSDRSGNQRNYQQTVIVEENPDYGKPICYLTFDDGPSSTTSEILEILNQYGIPATFFVSGADESSLSLLSTIQKNGHSIGLLSYSDSYPIVYASEEAYFDDLQKISDVVTKQTGIKADIIRFLGGSSNTLASTYCEGIMNLLVKDVEAKGYSYFDWNVSSQDDTGAYVDSETIVASACRGIGMDNVVIQLHDSSGKETTVHALPEIIQAYQNAGYVFRGLTRTSIPIHHYVS